MSLIAAAALAHVVWCPDTLNLAQSLPLYNVASRHNQFGFLRRRHEPDLGWVVHIVAPIERLRALLDRLQQVMESGH